MAEVVAGGGLRGNVGTVVCDLDGVVYVDGREVPGAGNAIAELHRSGAKVLFVTNNASKTQADVVETIGRFTGLAVDADDVVTSGLVTAMALEGKVERVYLIGGPALRDTFVSRGFEVVTDWRRAEAVAVGMDFGLTFDKLTAATLAVRAGAMFYATNADATYPTADGQIPGGGAIVAALETATGVEPVVCGKPHRPMAEAVRRLAGSSEVLVIGDRYETDIALGRSQGWATVLVLSGVAGSDDEAPPGLEPDAVVESLADVPELLRA